MLPCVYTVMAVMTRIFPAQQHPAALALVASTSPRTVILMFLSAVVLAPAAEELCFRVVLLGWLTRLMDPSARRGFEAAPELENLDARADNQAEPLYPADAFNPYRPPETPLMTLPITAPRQPSLAARMVPNLVTSLLFASLHIQQWPAPVALFVLSLALGELYQRTKSLIAPVAMHACFNGLSMTGVLLVSLSGMLPSEKPPLPPPAHALSLHESPATTQTSVPTIFPLGKADHDD
jgi:hypothetical protein